MTGLLTGSDFLVTGAAKASLESAITEEVVHVDAGAHTII